MSVTLNTATGRTGSKVVGLGHYRPERVVSNDELAKTIDTNDEWIRTRVGIAERHFAAPDETVEQMGAKAGEQAIADAGLRPSDIDTVIVATCTLPAQIRQASTKVASLLGIVSPGSFDINAACAGFCYGLANANSLIRSGEAGTVLLVGAEKLTDWVDPTDRANAIIFADGAGAAVITGNDTAEVGPVVWGSEIEHTETIGTTVPERKIYQEGQTVFRWATTKIPQLALDAVTKSGVQLSDIDVLVPHQANLRIVDAIARRLRAEGAREDLRVADDIVTTGNTSSASVPIALDRMRKAGTARSGDLVLAVGFGAGLTYAGQVFRCP